MFSIFKEVRREERCIGVSRWRDRCCMPCRSGDGDKREGCGGGGGWTNEVSQGADEPAIHTIPSTGEYNSDQSPALCPDEKRGKGVGYRFTLCR